MSRLAGIAGSLIPLRYLADAIDRDVPPVPADWLLEKQRRFVRWWNAVSRTCGPATGLRALFDLVAMPLFGMLGFRARDAAFDRQQARAWLATRQGTPVGLVLLPWADRPSALWRDVASAARDVGAAWAFLLAPPFLTLVDARGHAARREIEFTLPEALELASFARLWWLTRAAAFDPASGESASWLDTLVWRAAAYQDRVREDLQHGVAEALACLTAAIAPGHRSTSPAAPPRQMLRDAPVSAFDEALTIVYRILFLLFAESRELVPVRTPIYARGYAVGALGREARREDATGLWEGLAAITRLSRIGCHTDDLIVRPFNGRLFSRRTAPSLEAGPRGTRRARRAPALDGAARRALVALVSREGPGGREDLSYADLGVEQLGSVYEHVLDLAQPDGGPARQDLPLARASRGRHSARRKQTGTFYTPRALAEFLVRRTLAPLVAGSSADAILRLRVVDPAMGSGAFLVAACRFLASAYERALIDEGRIAPADLDEEERADIRRLIAERCLAGVDRNPTAVQLARLSLWLATLAHGKPLTFLDHRLRTGDSLIGASPADLSRTPSRRPAAAALPLFDQARLEESLRNAAVPLLGMAARRDDTVTDVRAKEALWRELTSPVSPLAVWRRAATLWCARWFWPAAEPAPNPAEWRALFDALLRGDASLPTAHRARRLAVAEAVGDRLRFFHWPLEFTDLFYDRHGEPLPKPGFDAVIGNPPWDMLRQGADVDGDRPALDRRALVLFVRDSGLYPGCDRGHVNLYQPFVERSLAIARPGGRVGLVLPWGLAADDGACALRRRLFETSAVDTLVGLDNADALFPIHRGLRFLVLTTTTGQATREIRARFGVRTAAVLDELPGRAAGPDEAPFPVRLTPTFIRRVGGAALRVPDVRRSSDLAILDRLTAAFPPLGGPAGWRVTFGRELNATEDREHFGAEGLPVLEGKHLVPFTVRTIEAAHRIERNRALRLLPDRRFERPRLGYRDVSGVGNRVSLIAAIIPAGVLTTHTVFCLRESVPIDAQHFLCALLNSYVLNTAARLLMGGHLTTTLVEGLPAPSWRADGRRERRIAAIAARLAGSPRATRLLARVHAEVARLYQLTVAEFDLMLEGFPLVPAEERALAARIFRALSGPRA